LHSDLANESINASTFDQINSKDVFQKAKVQQLLLALEVTLIVPLHYLVFHLADAAHVTVYFLDPVFIFALPVPVIIVHSLFRLRNNARLSPFNAGRVHETLH
jgi:hypothetical protein